MCRYDQCMGKLSMAPKECCGDFGFILCVEGRLMLTSLDQGGHRRPPARALYTVTAA